MIKLDFQKIEMLFWLERDDTKMSSNTQTISAQDEDDLYHDGTYKSRAVAVAEGWIVKKHPGTRLVLQKFFDFEELAGAACEYWISYNYLVAQGGRTSKSLLVQGTCNDDLKYFDMTDENLDDGSPY